MTTDLKRAPNPWLAVAILCGGFFMTILDTTIVNVAIPDIIRSLGAGLDGVLWVISAYVLAIAVLIVTAGRLGDILGPRLVFLAGLAVFTVASLFAGLAQNPGQLIAARAVQGVGAALLTPQPLTLMMALFPPDKRGVAGIVWGVSAGVAAVVGPTVGGVLVNWKGWPWIFYINIPVGIIAFILTLMFVPALKPGRRLRLDLPGVLVATAGFLAVSFGLLEGEHYKWGNVWGAINVVEIIVAGVLLLALFIVMQFRAGDEALVPMSLFRVRNYSLASIAGLAVSLGLTGVWVMLSIYLQMVHDFSALQAGLALAPGALVMFPIFGIGGNIVDKTGGKWLLVSGLVIFAGAAAYVIALTQAGAGIWLMMPGIVLAGIGQGLVFVPLVAIATYEVPQDKTGAASGAFNAIRQVGFVLAAAILGAVFQHRLDTALHAHVAPADAYVKAMLPTLGVVIAVFLVAAALCVAIRPRRTPAPAGDVEDAALLAST